MDQKSIPQGNKRKSIMNIPLQIWAQNNYNPAPSRAALHKARIEGRIIPAPQKCGRYWYVDENAIMVDTPSDPTGGDQVIQAILAKAT